MFFQLSKHDRTPSSCSDSDLCGGQSGSGDVPQSGLVAQAERKKKGAVQLEATIKRIMVVFDPGICAFSKGETGDGQKNIFVQGQNQKQMVQSPGTTGPNVCQSRFYLIVHF